ncbi:helix-turn-helix domain-containing protein [Streptomyces sp. NPDC059717]|uniref:helix-turn-helix domain-containing protein n=1 Tax=Streptomyces sp. NPDC059717 TaxID=3346922 RepID=UPI003684EEEF
MSNAIEPTQLPRLLLTAEQAAEVLQICRTKVYALMGSGHLRSVQIGRSRRIRSSDLQAFVDSLHNETPAA